MQRTAVPRGVLRARSRLLLGLAFGVLLSLTAPSCVTDTGSECSAGSEGCACAQENLCLAGLACMNGLCVNPGSGDTDGVGDGIGICEALISCAQEVEPAGSTSLIATYGPEGACWDLPGVEPIDCMRECRALMDGYRTLDPEALECAECSAADDCGSAVFDSDTLCVGLGVGTGVGICVEPIDECNLAEIFPYLPPRDDSCDYLPGEYVLARNPEKTHGYCAPACPADCPLGWHCPSVSLQSCADQCQSSTECSCGMECVSWDDFSKFCAYRL